MTTAGINAIFPAITATQIIIGNDKLFVQNRPIDSFDIYGLKDCSNIGFKLSKSINLDLSELTGGKLSMAYSYSGNIETCKIKCPDCSDGTETKTIGTHSGSMSGSWPVYVYGYPLTLGFSSYISGQTVETANSCTGESTKKECVNLGFNVNGSACFPPARGKVKPPIQVCVACQFGVEGQKCDGSPETWKPKGGCQLQWCTLGQCVVKKMF